MKIFSVLILCLLTFQVSANHSILTSSGVIKRYEDFSSRYVPSRTIDVWLPDSYSLEKKYDVLYMHDGQMLFDARHTWNNQEWKVDEVASKLIENSPVRPFIVVGIWHNEEKRYPEYFPEKVYRNLPLHQRALVKAKLTVQSRSIAPIGDFFTGDDYVQFLAKELVPFIEQNYNVNRGYQHRFLAGSSMGALISWYALFERPDVFGGAISMSTHWPGMYDPDNPFPSGFKEYFETNLHKLSDHKLYFDLGDQTLDALYPPLQKNIDHVLESQYPKDLWRSEYFPGQKHDEVSWASRLHIPLTFMFGNKE